MDEVGLDKVVNGEGITWMGSDRDEVSCLELCLQGVEVEMKGSKQEPRKFIETSSLMACRQTEGCKESG
jgi:hypothetical protein